MSEAAARKYDPIAVSAESTSPARLRKTFSGAGPAGLTAVADAPVFVADRTGGLSSFFAGGR